MEKTDFLDLELPNNNENQDNWDEPVNANFKKIDAFCKDLGEEVSNASGNKKSLEEYLRVAHDEDGNTKRTEEMERASQSMIYGDIDENSKPRTLPTRLELIDYDLIKMRNGFSSMDDKLALMMQDKNLVMNCSMDANGYPTWFGVTGVNATMDGSETPIWFMINGILKRINKQVQVKVQNVPAGTKYFYVKHGEGEVLSSGSEGIVGSLDDRKNIFQDDNANFVLSGIKEGYVLTVFGTTANARKYVIQKVEEKRLTIVGLFPGAAMGNMQYEIRDLMAPDVGFDAIKESGKFYVAEAYWDGYSLSKAISICKGDVFVGEWKDVYIDSNNLNFEHEWLHNMFNSNITVEVQVSEANDDTKPIERLSVASFESSLIPDVVNTLALSPNEPQSLTGNLSVSLAGTITPTRSVAMQWTGKSVKIKNIKPGVFYTSYDGNVKLAGYVRVVCRLTK